MLLVKGIGCLLITLGTVTILAAQANQTPAKPIPTPTGIIRVDPDPRKPTPPGDPTAANIRDWHCETPMLDLSSPTMAYKTLYFAVKCKSTATIKKVLSAETVKFITATSAMQKKPFDEAIQHGLTESTFSATLPQICKERIKDKMGAVEVKGTGKWEDLPFIFEDGSWKLAVGDIFNGSYQSPSEAICTPPMLMPKPDVRATPPMPQVKPGPQMPPPASTPTKP